MSDTTIVNLSRRRFLRSTLAASAGLTLGTYLPVRADAPAAGPGKAGSGISGEAAFEPNAFVRIGTDNSVTVIAKHLEMGQGTYTGLATLVAEELDAAWDQVRVEGAPADAGRYRNLYWGQAQGTGGSTAIANSYEQMRKAGAAARAMLTAAAAARWQVPEAEIDVRDGILSHAGSGHRATFGELAAAAAAQPVPADVVLKDPSAFRLIGTRLPRKDSREKTDGSAIFTQDLRLPGMLTACVAHPPRFGASVKSVNASGAKAIAGVIAVLDIPTGVAVLARDTWGALTGRDALSIEWDEGAAFRLGSAGILDDYRELAEKPGAVARDEGDAGTTMKAAARVITADYEFPYLAHAAMEPMDCVVQLKPNGCEIWNGEQMQSGDQAAVAAFLGIEPEQVRINMLYAGGSFGRRANPKADYVLEAVSIARAYADAHGDLVPVRMIWTREDDMRAGWYRPLYLHRIRAGLDERNNPVAWQHRVVGQSIAAGSPFEDALVRDGVDQTSVEGAANVPYAIPNIRVDLQTTTLPVPVQWWRSVGSTHTAFVVETFIDELAGAAGQDPVAFRRALLKDHPRHLGVLELAAQKAGWGEPLPAGRGRGIAVHESFNSYVAEVAEVTVDGERFSVDRVVIAVDCGVAVNPDIVQAQMEGGMGYGLSAALMSEITLSEGRVDQSNFHDYEVLRIGQMPSVEVHIVKSPEPPTGAGEPATPVIAPAVANALHAATGRRFYRLPLKLKA